LRWGRGHLSVREGRIRDGISNNNNNTINNNNKKKITGGSERAAVEAAGAERKINACFRLEKGVLSLEKGPLETALGDPLG